MRNGDPAVLLVERDGAKKKFTVRFFWNSVEPSPNYRTVNVWAPNQLKKPIDVLWNHVLWLMVLPLVTPACLLMGEIGKFQS